MIPRVTRGSQCCKDDCSGFRISPCKFVSPLTPFSRAYGLRVFFRILLCKTGLVGRSESFPAS